MTPLVWFGSAAHAAPQSVTVCARYAVAFRDAHPAVGDDFMTDDQPRAARGATQSGTLPGCVP